MTVSSAHQSVLRAAGTVPVWSPKDLGAVDRVVQAMIVKGVTVLEVALRTPDALAALTLVRNTYPHLFVGAGTVVTPRLAAQAQAAGAQFLVTPGSTRELLAASADTGLPVIPGAGTISELMVLQESGFTTVKVFPASQLGGPGFCKAVGDVLPDLGLMPTGGITESTAPLFLELPNVLCVGSSWR